MKPLAIMAIPLSQGLFALVDGEDYEELSKYKWCANKIGDIYYAVRLRWVSTNKYDTVMMHRQILKAPANAIVDHRNHCGLDNRKQTIRLCTRSQNNQNQRPLRGGTSKYKGIYWSGYFKKWHCRINHNCKNIYIGYFESEVEAAKAYDKKAKELFGEFAYTNFKD